MFYEVTQKKYYYQLINFVNIRIKKACNPLTTESRVRCKSRLNNEIVFLSAHIFRDGQLMTTLQRNLLSLFELVMKKINKMVKFVCQSFVVQA